jgi:hypothetical protein
MAVPTLRAQNFKGMSFNGATGLYLIPSAYVGWGGASPFGVDVGYHIGITRRPNHVLNANVTVLRWVEVSAALDLQDDYQYGGFNGNNNDLTLGTKVQLPVFSAFVLAVGGNFQMLNLNNDRNRSEPQWYRRNVDGFYHAGQIYAAITYTSNILGMETDTSIVMGKTFYDPIDSTIDFGIGFDCILFPYYLQRIVHGIVEFSNFSYSVSCPPHFSPGRGILNLGVRLDFSALPALSKGKVTFDALLSDSLDANRSFALGLALGLPL